MLPSDARILAVAAALVGLVDALAAERRGDDVDELLAFPFGLERRAARGLMRGGRLATTRIGRRIYAKRSALLALVLILLLRGEPVMVDEDLAALYGVPNKALIQAVKRNANRFTSDFIFQLTPEEGTRLRSQTVTAKPGRGGRRTLPYAFTEQGVAMLSSVLHSERAVHVNIEIMRAFVRLRAMLAGNADLARKLGALERKYDAQFKVVFHAIRELMAPPPKPRRPIGFRS